MAAAALEAIGVAHAALEHADAAWSDNAEVQEKAAALKQELRRTETPRPAPTSSHT